MKITCARDELVAEARRRLPRRLDPRHRADPVRDPAPRRRTARSSSPRPTWSSRCARRSRPQVDGRGRGRHPRQAARRSRAAAAGERGDDRVPPGGGRRPDRLRARRATRLNTLQRRGLPAAAGRRRAAARDRPRGAARDGRPCRAVRVARRVAPGADRHPRALRGRQARDGRDRLLPALGQGDAARRPRAGARGDHPGARAPGARRGSARRGDTIELGVHENHVVFGDRRRVADDAPHRRPVPELQAAAARDVRGRADAAARGAPRRRPPRLRDGAAQLAAAAALRRGRADGLGADPGRGRGARVAAGRATRASRSRSASTPSSCATASSRSTATRCA